MHRSWILALLLLTAFLAGCADEGSTDVVDDTPVQPTDEEEAPQPVFGPHSGLPREHAAGYSYSLDAPPQWRLGEWWTFDISSELTGEAYQGSRIVAGKEGPDYLVGQPQASFSDEIMVMHVPGFGLVNARNLGFEAHDVFFQPLDFPLTEGKSWETPFQSTSSMVQITVESIADGKAFLLMTGAYSGEMIYDTAMGAISYMDISGYATYTITGHGTGWEGTVRVPHSHDLIFFHGRLAGVQGLSPDNQDILTPNPVLPMETITVSDKYDRVSFGLIFQDIGANPVSGSGLFQLDVTAPNGETYTAQKLPTDNRGFMMVGAHNDEPAGDWEVTHIAAGAGVTLLEGIGYVTFDVELPSGCVQLTSKVHDHGGDCGGHVHDIE